MNSIATLLSFSRQEAQLETMLTRIDEMNDKEFLEVWIENEAGGGGDGRGGWPYRGAVWYIHAAMKISYPKQ